MGKVKRRHWSLAHYHRWFIPLIRPVCWCWRGFGTCSGVHGYTGSNRCRWRVKVFGPECREPVVSEKHFHLPEKHQSPGREEILLVVRWAVEHKPKRGRQVYTTHSVTVTEHSKPVRTPRTWDGEGAGKKSPPNRSMICSSATSWVGVAFGGGGTGGPFLSCHKIWRAVIKSAQ